MSAVTGGIKLAPCGFHIVASLQRGAIGPDRVGWSEVLSQKRIARIARIPKARFKIVSGIVGMAAVLAMAALGVMSSYAPGSGPDYATGPMQTGATVTQSTAPSEPETSVAKPPFTWTTPEGFAVPH